MEKTINDLNEEKKLLYKQIHEIDDKIRETELSQLHLDCKGKFIKYKNDFGIEHYCHVSTIMKDKYTYPEFNICYLIRGLGFDGEFTGYGDETDFNWSYWYEFYIYAQNANEFSKKTENIKEITKEEFNSKFYSYIEKLLEYHEDYSYD